MYSRSGAFVLILTLSMVAAGSGTVSGQGRWTNYVNASMINEIVHRDGQLYAATFGGLLVYDIGADRFTQFTNASGLPSNSLTAIAFDPSGSIWVGTDDIGVARVSISNGSLRLERSINQQIDRLADNAVRSVAVWNDDIVYGTANGMGLIIRDIPSTPYLERDGLPDNVVNDVFPDGDFVWIATDSGIVVLNDLGLLQSVAGAPPDAKVFATDGGSIWAGTAGGVFRFDKSDSSWSDLGLNFAGRPIYSLFNDGQSMWAGGRFVVSRYLGSGQSWASTRLDSFVIRYELSGVEVEARGLAVLPGGVYAGVAQREATRGFNLVRYDGTVSENLAPNTPGANDAIRLSFDETEGALWTSFFSYYVGKLLPDGTWVNYNSSIPESDSLSSRFANLTCHAGSDGTKYFCTLSTVAAPRPLDKLVDNRDGDYSNDTWERVGIGDGGRDGLGSLRLQRATEDPRGQVWFLSDADDETGAWQGMHIYNPSNDEWLQVTPATEPNMPDGNVVDVAFGSGATWVAMRRWGVQLWNHRSFDWANLVNLGSHQWLTSVRVGDEISSTADITSLARRSDGVLWIGTTDGVYKFNGLTVTAHIGAYIGFGVGLLGPQVRDIALDADENLWVATGSGINRISRDDDNDITAYSTPAEYQRTLADLSYPVDVITPLVNADCRALAIHPSRDLMFIGTQVGISLFDFSPPPETPTDLSVVYVYPNPVYGRKGHDELKIENITGPVEVEVYTLEGELVQRRSVSQPGEVVWDLTTNQGVIAASGTYLVRISNETGSVVKTVALLR